MLVECVRREVQEYVMIRTAINANDKRWVTVLRHLSAGRSVELTLRNRVIGTLVPPAEGRPLAITPEQEARFDDRVAAENCRRPPVEFHSVKQTLEYLEERFGTDAHRDDRRVPGHAASPARRPKNRRAARHRTNP
jgi:hypothetical protein